VAPTLSFVTAALLVAQTPATPAATAQSTCPCQKNNGNVAQVQYIQPVPATPAEIAATSGNQPAQNDNHPILNRIRNFFRGTPKDQSADQVQFQGQVQVQGQIVTSEPPVDQKKSWLPMPRTSTPSTPIVTPTSAPIAPVVAPSPSIPAATPIAPAALPAAPVKIITPASATTPVSTPVAIPVTSAPITQSVPVVTTAPTVTPLPSRPSKISPDLISKVGHAEDYAWITGQIRIENGVHVLHYATPETVDRFNGHVVLQSSGQDLRNVPEGAYVCVRGSVGQQTAGNTTYRVQALDILTASR
jgi:hypothetical protein